MPKAEKLALEMDAKLKAAEKQTAAIKERKRILFLLSAQDGKIFAASSDTAGDGIIKLLMRSSVSPATADVRGGDRHCQAGHDPADEECRAADIGGRAVREPLHRLDSLA
ncbi:hypothetical protein NKH71_03730 [Mesorhizobium sp. M0983]|uniref:hypothetical protein n=1 Tax=Mesorhizobium sp. M0983 TaxID=2957040 RepID=UPI0033398FB5